MATASPGRFPGVARAARGESRDGPEEVSALRPIFGRGSRSGFGDESSLVFATTIGTPLDTRDDVNRHFKWLRAANYLRHVASLEWRKPTILRLRPALMPHARLARNYWGSSLFRVMNRKLFLFQVFGLSIPIVEADERTRTADLISLRVIILVWHEVAQ
jgi:hypothetical protein